MLKWVSRCNDCNGDNCSSCYSRGQRVIRVYCDSCGEEIPTWGYSSVFYDDSNGYDEYVCEDCRIRALEYNGMYDLDDIQEALDECEMDVDEYIDQMQTESCVYDGAEYEEQRGWIA